MSKSFLIDTTLCTACRGCQVACKQWHDLPAEKTVNRGSYQNPEDLKLAELILRNLVQIFGVEIDKVTREMRSRAKTANFGIIYGISSFGLSERLTISRKDAKELIDGYFNSYPGVRKYMDESIQRARENGYVTTMFGRKRYTRDIHSRNQVVRGNAERNAINAPIQGAAADIIKMAMVNIYRKLREEKLRSKMILQVHDELIFEVPPEELEALKTIAINEMSGAASLSVPLKVDWGTGSNWLEAH